MRNLKLFLSIFRGLFIALNMLILGGLFSFLYFILGYNITSKLGISWLWGKLFIWIVTSKLIIIGKKNIPQKDGAIFLFSHSSYLDIPILCATKNWKINFVAKSYLLDYPVLGFIMKLVKMIIIYPDRRESIKQYKLAEERLKQGESFMIAPEGSRSSGEELLPFKSGPFIFAMNARADLVPVLIYGSHKIWPKKDKLPNMRNLFGTIYIEYLPKVSIIDFKEENRKEKAEEVRQMMLKKLVKYQKLKSIF